MINLRCTTALVVCVAAILCGTNICRNTNIFVHFVLLLVVIDMIRQAKKCKRPGIPYPRNFA